MLGCKPDLESLKEFANKAPDRWAQSVAIMAKNSGYSEKHTVEHNHTLLIAQLSDADLFARLRELEGQLAGSLEAPKPAIEHQTPT
jgi:hypothetical protein